jgi:hypothetical protein
MEKLSVLARMLNAGLNGFAAFMIRKFARDGRKEQ